MIQGMFEGGWYDTTMGWGRDIEFINLMTIIVYRFGCGVFISTIAMSKDNLCWRHVKFSIEYK